MQQLLLTGLRKLRLLKSLNFSFRKSVNNTTFSVPLVNGNGQQNFIVHEEWMQEVLRILVSIKKGAFMDVGVNVGQTLLKIKSIDADIPYYGFEPNPTCVYYLNQLIERNRIKNVFLFPVAIADQTKITELNLYYDSDTDSAASMIKDFRPDALVRKTMYIPCFSVEDVTAFIDISSLSIIKVDVEGAELEVLKGIRTFLENSRPFIVMEILPVYQAENIRRLQRQIELERILSSHNYKILRIRKENDHFLSFEPIDAIGVHYNQEWCDYVFCPNELLPRLPLNI